MNDDDVVSRIRIYPYRGDEPPRQWKKPRWRRPHIRAGAIIGAEFDSDWAKAACRLWERACRGWWDGRCRCADDALAVWGEIIETDAISLPAPPACVDLRDPDARREAARMRRLRELVFDERKKFRDRFHARLMEAAGACYAGGGSTRV